MVEYSGGAPAVFVPDNLRSGVTRACRYEPVINRTYLEFAEHYGAAVVAARAGRPRDTAVVEASVLLAQRWILAVFRNRRFFSVAERVVQLAHVYHPLVLAPRGLTRAGVAIRGRL
jgi:transposase